MEKPPLDPAVRRKNRRLLAGIIVAVLAVVVWSLLFLHEHGLNLKGGYH